MRDNGFVAFVFTSFHDYFTHFQYSQIRRWANRGTLAFLHNDPHWNQSHNGNESSELETATTPETENNRYH